MTQKLLVVRVKGGLVEELEGAGATRIGEPVEVPADIADRLAKDGTDRFRAATDVEAKAHQAKKDAVVKARVKAATTGGGSQ